jgi:hypothetical protein
VKYQPEQDRNTLAMHAEAPFDVSKTLEFEITGELYDRLAIWMFSNAIRGNVTPSQPDNMNEPLHYLWLFEPSLATNPNTPDATNGIDTFTFEYGDNIQAYEVEYGFTIGLEISGVPNEPVQFTWNLGGRQVTATTFTGALTEPARKAFFAFNSANYYIDTAYADIGDTIQAGMLKGFTYKFETQFTPRFTANGALYFNALNEAKKTVDLELTYVRDSSLMVAEHAKFVANSLFFPRIALISNLEMDSGQSNPEYIYLDGAFRYTEFPEYEDEDGTHVVTVTAQGYQDPTSGKMMSVSVGTLLAAFPS